MAWTVAVMLQPVVPVVIFLYIVRRLCCCLVCTPIVSIAVLIPRTVLDPVTPASPTSCLANIVFTARNQWRLRRGGSPTPPTSQDYGWAACVLYATR